MLTRSEVVAWAADHCGPDHAEQRVAEGPAAFLVNVAYDADLANGGGDSLIVVRKRTGEFWYVAGDPEFVHTAKNDRRLLRAIKHMVPFASQPAGVIGAPPARQPGLTTEQLGAWLRATRSWQHIDDRIGDLGWAFVVSTQPDAYHDGNEYAMTYGNGPLVVAKRTGEVWALPSTPDMVPAFNARNEHDFHRILADAWPGANVPSEWVRF